MELKIISAAAAILTWLRKQSRTQSSQRWQEWQHAMALLNRTFHIESEVRSAIQVGLTKGAEAKTREESMVLYNELPPDPQVQVLSFVWLFVVLEERAGETINAAQHTRIFRPFLKDKKHKNEIDERAEKHLNKIELNERKPPIVLNTTLLPITIDYLLRWLVLWLYQSGYISDGYFAFLQIIGIGILSAGAAVIRSTIVNTRYTKTLAELRIQPHRVRLKISPTQYTIMALYALSGYFIGLLTLSKYVEGGVIVTFFTFGLPYAAYLLVLLRQFSQAMPNAQAIKSQDERIKEEFKESAFDPDKNDEVLTDTEVDLGSLSQLMEAYILEGALFGALAFSGFLQIIVADSFEIKSIFTFVSTLGDLLKHIVQFRSEGIAGTIDTLGGRDNLLSLICFESLFCSLCFLAVVASRLQFSDIADKVQKSLQRARILNEKEEEVIENGKPKAGFEDRYRHLNQKIANELNSARQNLLDAEPVLVFMRYFRTLGIGTFFIIVISSALLLSLPLALVFSMVFALTTVYFQFGVVQEMIATGLIKLQEEYLLRSKRLYIISFSLSATVFIPYMTIPASAGILLLGILALTHALTSRNEKSIAVRPISDALNSQSLAQLQRWSVGLSDLLLCVTVMMHFVLQIQAGDEAFIFAALAYTVRFGMAIIDTRNHKIWRWFVGISLPLILFGLIFKHLNQPGATILLILGALGSLPLLIAVILRKDGLLASLRRSVIVISMTLLLTLPIYPSFFVWFMLTNATVDVGRIHLGWLAFGKSNPEWIDVVRYIDTYQLHDVKVLEEQVKNILNDSTAGREQLSKAAIWAQRIEIIEAEDTLAYKNLYHLSKLLFKLERYSEAKEKLIMLQKRVRLQAVNDEKLIADIEKMLQITDTKIIH